MNRKENILINRIGVDYDYLEKNKHEISPKETFDCMDEYAEYVVLEAWKIAKDYGFDLAGEWVTSKKVERIKFEDWFEQFKAKENEQGNKV
jgi:hypothetical protein